MKHVSDLRFILIGTGACGTGYASVLLNSCGVKTGHEAVFNPFRTTDEPIPDDLVGESSYVAVPYIETTRPSGTVVVHLVRDTLSVIRSLIGRKHALGGNEWYDAHTHEHVPGIVELLKDPIDAMMLYYLRWNERCEAISQRRFRVEDLTTVTAVRELLSCILCDASDEQIESALRSTPTNYNSRPRGSVEVEDILSRSLGRDVMDMAERYGYSLA